jgi:iron complex transport system substrate-binding protein
MSSPPANRGRGLADAKPNLAAMFPPERIVCLTEETVETLYLLGEERRIVGVSGYAVRPARVRREKPRVSAFISADFAKILEQRLAQARERAAALKRRPRVYFEEWDEPMISGIRWVTELIEVAGGIDVFPALSRRKNAKDRIVSGEDLIAANPDIIIGSWCGKKFVPAKVAARPGFADVAAVRDGFLREIKSPLILQPGPAALTDGLDALAGIIEEWAAQSARG